jgi:cardiolipin synthase
MIMVKTVLIADNHGARRPPDAYAEGVSTPDTTLEPSAGTEKPGIFDDLWTVPNAFTLLRLLCLPFFLYLLFPAENPAGAAWLLALLGSTDWVDGYIARRFDQESEFGKVFDPTVDRLFFFVSIVAIIIEGSIPLWFALAVLLRELLVGGVMAFATLFLKMERFSVTWWGKTATFLLMGAVPSFLLGEADVWESPFFAALAWMLGVPGLVLSWYTAIAYIPLVRTGITAGRASTSTRSADR